MKTGTSIAIAVILGAGGYYAYKKWKENQDKPSIDDGGDSGSGAGAGTSTGSSALVNPNIRQLQTWLQITADGVAGKITNGKVEYYWSAYDNTFDADRMFKEGYPNLQKAKGVVTESNALYYLDILKKSASPRQLYEINKGKTAASAATAADKTKRANAIKSAYTGRMKLRTNGVFTFTDVVYDAASKTYRSTGSTHKYNANATFIIPENMSTASGGLVKITDITTSGNLIVAISPVIGSNFVLMISPYDLSVTA